MNLTQYIISYIYRKHWLWSNVRILYRNISHWIVNIGKLESRIRNRKSILELCGKRLVSMLADKENVMHLRTEQTSARRAFVWPPLRISSSIADPIPVHRWKSRTLNPAEPLSCELEDIHPPTFHRLFPYCVSTGCFSEGLSIIYDNDKT